MCAQYAQKKSAIKATKATGQLRKGMECASPVGLQLPIKVPKGM